MKFEATEREPGGEREGGAGCVGELAAEADNLMNLVPGKIRFGAESGVADDVEVGEAGEAEGLRDAASAGDFDVEDGVGGEAGTAVELIAEVERSEEGGFVFAAGKGGVDAGVGGVEGGVGLEDDVGLAEDEVGFGVGMPEDGGRDVGCGSGV